MDVISLYYFSELAKDLNMTQTANRLFISQQTLSNHMQRLEEYYGVQLLFRKPSLSLTYAGERVLLFAQDVNKGQMNLKDMLADIGQQKRGVLRLGGSTLRLNLCLPEILPAFSERYPDVEIRLTNAISADLEPQIISGELDLALVVSREKNPLLVERHLMDDQIYLCVANSLLGRYYDAETVEMLKEKSLCGASLRDFDRLPFCTFSNRMGRQVQKCFDEAGVTPKVYMNSAYTQLSTRICFKGLACSFVTQMRLAEGRDEIPEGMNIFPMTTQDAPLIQRLSVIRRKDRYLSHFAQYFEELLEHWAADVEEVPVARRA